MLKDIIDRIDIDIENDKVFNDLKYYDLVKTYDFDLDADIDYNEIEVISYAE